MCITCGKLRPTRDFTGNPDLDRVPLQRASTPLRHHIMPAGPRKARSCGLKRSLHPQERPCCWVSRPFAILPQCKAQLWKSPVSVIGTRTRLRAPDCGLRPRVSPGPLLRQCTIRQPLGSGTTVRNPTAIAGRRPVDEERLAHQVPLRDDGPRERPEPGVERPWAVVAADEVLAGLSGRRGCPGWRGRVPPVHIRPSGRRPRSGNTRRGRGEGTPGPTAPAAGADVDLGGQPFGSQPLGSPLDGWSYSMPLVAGQGAGRVDNVAFGGDVPVGRDRSGPAGRPSTTGAWPSGRRWPPGRSTALPTGSSRRPPGQPVGR